jgi:hypothetical protein
MTYLTCFCPEGAAAQSPGLLLRLPWELKQKEFLNRKAAVSGLPGSLAQLLVLPGETVATALRF